jgi:hypothetical protein
MENGKQKIVLRLAAGFLAGILIIVAVFSSGVTFPSLVNNLQLENDQGNLTVLLIDAPVEVDQLWLNITEVMIHKISPEDSETVPEVEDSEEEEDDDGWISLDLSGALNENGVIIFNLLEYQINGEEEDKVLNLADGLIKAGTYNKIRCARAKF